MPYCLTSRNLDFFIVQRNDVINFESFNNFAGVLFQLGLRLIFSLLDYE